MYEISQYINSKDKMNKAEKGFYFIDNPNGTFSAAGYGIPQDIMYIDATPELIERAKFGARFGPKPRRFASYDDAAKFANDMGYFADSEGRFTQNA